MEYQQHLLALAVEIMRILAKGLQCGDDVFDAYAEDPVANVKLHVIRRKMRTGR